MGQQVMTVEEPETDEADFLSAFHPAAPHYYRPAPVEPVTADDEDDEEFNSCANCRIAARYVM